MLLRFRAGPSPGTHSITRSGFFFSIDVLQCFYASGQAPHGSRKSRNQSDSHLFVSAQERKHRHCRLPKVGVGITIAPIQDKKNALQILQRIFIQNKQPFR
jgi:hypothetical protein